VICDGTTERQQVLVSTLGQVAEDAAASGVRPPAVVVVGEVVRLREALGQEAPAREAPGQEAPARDTLGAA
jgi:uroporphyrin-III C-methyltransferase